MESEKPRIATEDEVLDVLTRIVRREETEDNAIKLRCESKVFDENGKSCTERSEHVEIVKMRPKLSDVIKACELIGKSYGMFSERVEGSIALPLIICGEDDLE